jgi:hypothetical protein
MSIKKTKIRQNTKAKNNTIHPSLISWLEGRLCIPTGVLQCIATNKLGVRIRVGIRVSFNIRVSLGSGSGSGSVSGSVRVRLKFRARIRVGIWVRVRVRVRDKVGIGRKVGLGLRRISQKRKESPSVDATGLG